MEISEIKDFRMHIHHLKGLVCAIFVILVIGCLFGFLFNYSENEFKVAAYETTCPDYMTDEECLDFLQEQAEIIEGEKGTLVESINAEDFEQMSLYQQISYLNSLIEQTELQIAEKEVDIETKNVEINLLGKEIIKAQNSIDTIIQEINILELTMTKRTKSSYKMTFMSPMEVVLDSNDFESLLRRMKYLVEAKKQDRILLTDMSIAKDQLAEEQELLEVKRTEVQSKRNDVEAELTELANTKNSLDSQQAQQQALMAESQRREAEIRANLGNLQGAINSLDAQILAIATRMQEEGTLVKEGYVGKGTTIGLMGNSGCIPMSAHLHFSINNNPDADCSVCVPDTGECYYIHGEWCGTVSPWAGYLTLGPDFRGYWGAFPLYYIHSNSFSVPLADIYGNMPYITQTEHQGTAIDMSTGVPGTPVLAAAGGELETGYYDKCGGKFAKIRHSNGLVTVYLHLR